MFTASHRDYAKLADDELLQLASDRESLTDEAKVALDGEMRTRNLAAVDVTKHETFVKNNERRERRRRKRRLRSRGWSVETAVMLFWTVLAISLISIAYLALSPRFHFHGNWEEAAEYVMFSSVPLIVASGNWRRKMWFWVVLTISSTAHLLIVHAWIARVGTLQGSGDRSDRLAIFLGLVLFFAVCACRFILRRKLFGERAGSEGA
jgi:hypothetical protein